MGFGALAAQLGVDLIGTAYGIYQDQRNYDYQKDLQKKIFEREDNAVQRRRADLEAAGMNPNLAAGSAAGAGQVAATGGTSSRISSPDILGNMIAFQQAKQQKIESEIVTEDLKVAKQRAKSEARAQHLEQIESFYNTGVDPQYYYVDPLTYEIFSNTSHYLDGYIHVNAAGEHYILKYDNNGDSVQCPRLDHTRIWQLLRNGYNVNNAETQMILNEADWQSTDRAIQHVEQGLRTVTGAVGDVLHGAADIKDSNTRARDVEAKSKNYGKSYTEEFTRTRRGYTKTRRY